MSVVVSNPRINKDKAKAAVLFILQELKTADFIRIFKILYFAEREHLVKWGRPITFDKYIAMEHGPVPSVIFDVFKALRGDGFKSSQLEGLYDGFEVINKYEVRPLEKVDVDQLSLSDIDCLNKSIVENRDLSFGELSDKSHGYAHNHSAKDDMMSFLDIAIEGGADEEMLKYITSTLENNAIFSQDNAVG